ncbi:MAG: hypothetical protein MZV64_34810 [Ignavibacteriales bacterium]|nr:hypothetical protein [Ignavibacteriales bacterium]
MRVGDFVRLTSGLRCGRRRTARPRPAALFEVLEKQRRGDNRIELTAIDTRLDRCRYPLIAPAGPDRRLRRTRPPQQRGRSTGSPATPTTASRLGDDGYYSPLRGALGRGPETEPRRQTMAWQNDRGQRDRRQQPAQPDPARQDPGQPRPPARRSARR